MKRFALLGLAPVVLSVSVAAAAEKHAPLSIQTLTSAEARFGDGPEDSVKVAHIYGDPDKDGMFVMWMKMPAGAQTPPHWYASDKIFTVLSGSIGLGLGDTFDENAGKEIQAGGFAVIPAKAHHFGWSKDGALIQVQGMGPFKMHWLEP
ncbi:MAG: cupin domain-containing protein [Nevskiales bacterium]